MTASQGNQLVAAHFRRYGALAYRLALAMLQSEPAAAETVMSVFLQLGNKTHAPSWRRTLAAVRTRCMDLPHDASAGPPSAADLESEVIHDAADVLELPLPTAMTAAAFAALDPADRRVLWSALTDSDREPLTASRVDELAGALRRLEIAAANLSIPDAGGVEWPR